jgi:uncharacterized repeat protein (TIGR03803 family)
MRRLVFFAVLFVMSAFSIAHGQTYTVLHSFNGASDEGAGPQGSLTLVGSALYGTTGGLGGIGGTVFKVNTDGTAFGLLHSFGVYPDGFNPRGSLTLGPDGSTLYGTTFLGGNNGLGTIFKIGTDGSNYGRLHWFIGGSMGANPYADGLTFSSDGSTLYGMTKDAPSLYKIGADGSGYSVIYPIGGPAGLTLSGSTLYGTDVNNIFKIGIDGSGFNLLHSFDGYSSAYGGGPMGSLTLSGSVLYGMTNGGGTNNGGTVFKVNTDGSGFSLLHSFFGGVDDGIFPFNDLTLSGSTLYGMTTAGGTNNDGTIFSINTDGTDFSLLHSFHGSDGATPYSGLTFDGSTLYGVTASGGDYSGGVVFSLTVPEPSIFALLGIGAASFLAYGWWNRRRRA